jgi:multidrug efflux pump subunit AcrA (membrane-fusion protein)
MPALRPPGGRRAAATVIKEPVDEASHEENESQINDGLSEAPEAVAGDETVSLREQIAALEKSNREYRERVESERQRAEQAVKAVQDRDAEVNKLQEQTVNSQADAINAAMAAAQAEADSAQRDIEAATTIGDTKALSEAYRKLSRAEGKLLRLEDGKEALEREISERPKPQERSQVQQDPVDNLNLPSLAKSWLRDHPEFLTNPRKNSKLQALHWDVVDEGLEPYSRDYFEVLEERLGLRQAARRQPVEQDVDDDDEPQVRPTKRATVSAPPSREVPSTSGVRNDGKIRLSREEKEAARISGISEEEYAKQKIIMMQEKSKGNYGGAP